MWAGRNSKVVWRRPIWLKLAAMLKDNVPFGGMSGSRAREPLNNELNEKTKEKI